jgi:hypothetical protein
MKKYEELCNSIQKSKYKVIKIKDFFKNPDLNRFIILKHDVDKLPENALVMAQLEKVLGIKSTYYFRTISEVFKPNIIQEISTLGHEIGYHYENLSQTNGNFEKALKLFEKDLERLRKITQIDTICMHGSPLSKWNNSDLWNKYDFKKFGIIGETNLSIDYKDITYFTDTGRNWSNKGSVRDFVKNSLEWKEKIKSTNDLRKLIETQKLNKIIITAHPQRWSIKNTKWFKELIGQSVKNVGKDLILKRKNRSKVRSNGIK